MRRNERTKEVRSVSHRVDWDQYFMNIAGEVATRSTCDRKHVGAVVYATGEIRESDDDEYQYAIEVESYTIEEPEDDPDPYPCN